MAFWSGQELARRAASEKLISNFDAKNIDCASYTLHLGSQLFITQEGRAFRKLLDRGQVPGLKEIEADGVVNIPPGQFAFLLTDEKVHMPPDALGFISIKARQKYKGLVNVSGFHVDPGWDGYLMFSVFNAGPIHIVLKRGEPLFLLWFASLDQKSKDEYTYDPRSRPESAEPKIPVKYVQELITAPVRSLPSLSEDLEKLKHRVVRGDIAFAIVLAVALVLVGLGVKSLIPTHDIKSRGTSGVTHFRPEPSLPQTIDSPEFPAPAADAKTSNGKRARAEPKGGDGKHSSDR